MKNEKDLKALLESIHRRGYPAYKDTRGSYHFGGYILHIDHVQGDPFASPSHLTIEVPGQKAGFPSEYLSPKHRRIALEDFLTRRFHSVSRRFDHQAKGSGKSGSISVVSPGQEILERTACLVDPKNGTVYYRFEVGFPANGRSINAYELIRILYDFLPVCVKQGLVYGNGMAEELKKAVELSDDQAAIREQIRELGLSAFVAEGAILPRKTGVSELPMKEARAFASPESLKVTLTLPHRGRLQGMGIPNGVTLIVGGGYHGKSTLLKALELGVYNHVAGDGREYVITDPTAVKIRSEDGRSVHGTDISLFINDLPDKRDTKSFHTEDASGSTSQAANVSEAIECGSRVLLIDEDTCATNFMIRDELMQKVIAKEKEPITPYLDRIGSLKDAGISTILVAGSFGAYFHVADTIIQMDHYEPVDITQKAKEAARDYPLPPKSTKPFSLPRMERKIQPVKGWDLNGRIKTKTMGRDGFMIERENVELRYLEQIVESGQVSALSKILLYGLRHMADGKHSPGEITGEMARILEKEGLDALYEHSYTAMGLTMVRPQEIAACLHRCRFL